MKGKSFFSVLAFILICQIVFGILINVPADEPTIQSGIVAAHDCDTVLVAPGTYYEKINFLGKEILVASWLITTGNPDFIAETIIDGEQNGCVVLFINGEESASLAGFTIRNGLSNNATYGGGISCRNQSTPFLQDLIITNNYGFRGGGIYCYRSSPVLENVTIDLNKAKYGAGIYCYADANPRLSNVTISRDSAYFNGGGMYCKYSNPRLENVDIIGNVASNFDGGGMYSINSYPLLENVHIEGNSASDDGGGIYCEHSGSGMSGPYLKKIQILGNSANRGGGIHLSRGSYPRIVDVLVAKNWADKGGGIYFYRSNPLILNATIADNTSSAADNGGGGIYCQFSYPTLKNCIMWNDLPEEIYIEYGAVTVSYSDIQGGFPGLNNFDSDPLFVDADDSNYHLSWDNYPDVYALHSPCIDRGDPAPNFNDPDGTINDQGAFYFDQFAIMSSPVSENKIERTFSEDDYSITRIFQNYPNPFNPETSINYSLDKGSEVKIEVFNSKGERVKTLVNKFQNEGSHDVLWNGKDEEQKAVSSGIYFYKIKAGNYNSTKKMILMK